MNYLLLFLATLCSSGKALMCKRVGKSAQDARSIALLNSATFAIALAESVIVMAVCRWKFEASPVTVILAAAYSCSMLLTQLCQVKALSLGNTAVTTLLYACGFLVPVLVGAAFWQEPVSVYQWLGVILLLCALVLIISPKRESGRVSVIWLAFCFACIMLSGCSAVLQKVHQRSEYAAELPSFLVCTFAFASVLSFGLHFLFPKTDAEPVQPRTFASLAAISGIILGAVNFLNLTLAGKIPSVIQFPIYNVGNVILTGIIGSLWFSEKTTVPQKLGFVLGCIAIAIIGML